MRKLLTCSLLAGGILGTTAGIAGSTSTDLLERPAQANVRAAKSVLLAIARADARLVAVGERGIVLLSDDNGASWRQAKVPASVALTNVRFVSGRQGWAIGHGGVVLHTADGGETWTKQLDGLQAALIELNAAKAASPESPSRRRRLAEAEGWVSDGPDKPFLDIHFLDEQHGLLVGAYGLIFATDDGGKTWRSLKDRLDNPKGKHLYVISALGEEVYIFGEQGAMYRSTDRAATFQELSSPYAGTLFGAVAASRDAIVAFGLRGNVYRTEDGGARWRKVDVGMPVTLTAGVRLGDGSVVLVDEGGRVLRSTDAGNSFASIPVARPSPFTGVAESAGGGLVLTGARGVSHLPLSTPSSDSKQ